MKALVWRHMQRSDQNNNKKASLKLALLFVFLVTILGSCIFPANDGDPRYATWTPSPSATPTCAPNIQLSTPEGWDTSSRFIVFLFDPRFTGNQQLELLSGEKIQDIPFFVSKIIPVLMKPGDQVSVFQLGYK